MGDSAEVDIVSIVIVHIVSIVIVHVIVHIVSIVIVHCEHCDHGDKQCFSFDFLGGEDDATREDLRVLNEALA